MSVNRWNCLLVCRWQLRVKPITSHVLNAHTAAVLYLHQIMQHLMEFCTANTTFHSFSKKREATTTWSNLHQWSVKQQLLNQTLQRWSYKLQICGFVEFISPLPFPFPSVFYFDPHGFVMNSHELSNLSCWENCLFGWINHRTSNKPLKVGNDLPKVYESILQLLVFLGFNKIDMEPELFPVFMTSSSGLEKGFIDPAQFVVYLPSKFYQSRSEVQSLIPRLLYSKIENYTNHRLRNFL